MNKRLTHSLKPCYPIVKLENDTDSRPMSRKPHIISKGSVASRPWSGDEAICAVCGEESRSLDDDLTCGTCRQSVDEEGMFRGTFLDDTE